MLRYHLKYGLLALLLLCCTLAGVFLSRSIFAEGRGGVTREGDLCYISAYEIDEAIDGTEPFDANDDRGNDSNRSNKIVRSFDSVNYTLKYTTALRDDSVQGVDSANVTVDFVLPCDPSVAAFNLDTMQWCLDRQVTYHYEDGTESTTWDPDKPVASQQLTGRRLLQNTDAGNTIPGTGTLSVGIMVKMAPNGQELKPRFTIWVEGNPEEEHRTVTDTVTVTAAPKYDLAVSRNTSADILGYYDPVSGQASSERASDTDLYGRLQGYGVSLSLYNDSAEKGMRGIEIPNGTITFDLRMSETRNGVDVSYEDAYQPFFWDYKMNSTSGSGTFGRDMSPLGQGIASYTTWQNNMPQNKRGSALYCCYDGGTMVITQDDTDPNLLHVTLDGYAFDKQNLQFPDRDSSDTAKTIADNIGYFSVGYVQTICQFPSDVEEIENIIVGLEASNLQATTLSGEKVTDDVVPSNNLRNATVTTYPKGSHSKRNFFYSSTGGTLAVPWSSGNAYAYVGQTVRIDGQMIFTGDSYLTGTNILQKFDDKYLEIPAGTIKYLYANKSNPESEVGPIKTLFAAKPDKTGWVDDAEMNNTREEQLVYFESIDALNDAGYTCVGVLYEVRDSKLLPNNGGGCIAIGMRFHVRTDCPSGVVAMTKNDVRSWGIDNPQAFSWTDVPYDASIGAYGLGDVSWASGTHTDGYAVPKYTTYLNYGKAVYENGTLVSGHTNGYQGGNSLLIISNKVGVSIQNGDTTESGKKTVYDLDAGERTASFVVTPTMVLDTANTDVSTSDIRDTVTVKVTLPDSLHYQETGVSVTPDTVTVQEDGTTVLTWTFADVPVQDGIDPIRFSAIIGEEGTANDVVNNQSMTVQATVTSVNDTRAITEANGKRSETSISVIRLAASAVTKRAIQPIVESGQEIGFRLRYSNLSDIIAEDAVLYDILPFDGDTAGSEFSGTYQLSRVLVDYSHAPETLAGQKDVLSVQVTGDEAGRTEEVRDDVLSGTVDDISFTELPLDLDGTYMVYEGRETATALSVSLGDVSGNEYIDIYLYLSPSEDGELLPDTQDQVQQPGDVYGNRFYQNADNQAAVVISNVVHTTVANRTLSSLVWEDRDYDGIRDDGEPLFEGARVSLYRTTPSGSDDPVTVAGQTVYPAYDVLGNPIKPFTTGADGSWSFSYLEAGTYLVQVTGIDDYYVTAKDIGEDDTLDSDAVVMGDEAYLDGIVLPELANLTEPAFSSEHHDTGLVRHTKVSIRKTDGEGNPLPGAELELYAGKDISEGAEPLFTWTSGETPYTLTDALLAGETYTLVEAKAPEGYLVADPVTFTVKDASEEQVITMVDLFRTSSLTLKKLDGRGNPLAGVTFRLTFTEAQGNQKGEYLLQEGESVEAVTDANGIIRFTNLDRGSYRFEEIETVEGQALLPDAIVLDLPLTLTENEVKELGNVDTSEAVFTDGTYYFFNCTYEIANDVALSMPKAGGTPIYVWAGLGCFVGMTGIVLWKRRAHKQ